MGIADCGFKSRVIPFSITKLQGAEPIGTNHDSTQKSL